LAADESSATRRRDGARRNTRDPVLVVDGPIRVSSLPSLCQRVSAAVQASTTKRVDCDVGSVADADVVAVEAFARMQLAARQLGGSVRFQRVSDEMVELLALFGLDNVLLADFDGTGELFGETEQGEQRGGVEERVDLADPSR
jgi:ABC-type transporter Mla MlaB component